MSYRNPLHGLDSDGEPATEFVPDDTAIDLPLDDSACTSDDSHIHLPGGHTVVLVPDDRVTQDAGTGGMVYRCRIGDCNWLFPTSESRDLHHRGEGPDGAAHALRPLPTAAGIHHDGDLRRTESGQLQEWSHGAWYNVDDPPPPALQHDSPFTPTQADRLVRLAEDFTSNVQALLGEHTPAGANTDGGTRAFQAATGHQCLACPLPVRDLYAAAHNAVMALAPLDLDPRADRKVSELHTVVERLRPAVESHFNALNQWSHR